MADWQQFIQSVFIGVIFSYLLAKLFSVIFAFHQENLRITRSDSPESDLEFEQRSGDSSSRVLEENKPLINEDSSVSSGHSDSDDDWEGVESTELDEIFSAATAFVAATAVDRAALKVSNDVQLQLYGLYKIATEGPCSVPQPSALKITARAKWSEVRQVVRQAWQKMGSMPPEEAMEKYIDIVCELYPSWAAGSATKKKHEESSDAPNAGSNGPIGPVFSTFIYEEEPGWMFANAFGKSEAVAFAKSKKKKLDAIHAFAREGDDDKLVKCIESGVPLNLKDSEGRTPLHWAVDRGHMNTAELLLNKKADVNAKDDEGQTALHYAAVCDRAPIAELLVKNGADMEIKDDEGNTPRDLCELSSPWLQLISKSTY
ncbi:hypothetical protein RD792_013597 [Penstemon davidsonii]|uniref:ACB domain-containing protein n=1 Tax=Penstemon davidsonii TaxID=160366 RepID=A0ABR0CVI0_9LAMI|nr:hypothetical protein RD792_013597 [Penstemon davidsonii]